MFLLWVLHATFANMQVRRGSGPAASSAPLTTAQGLLNSVAYGLTDGVRDELRQRWQALCGGRTHLRQEGLRGPPN